MDPFSGFSHAETVVLNLMEKLLDHGHTLYVDNFYTNVALAKALLNQKTLICAILRKTPAKKIISTKLKKDSTLQNKKGLLLLKSGKIKGKCLCSQHIIPEKWLRATDKQKEETKKSESLLCRKKLYVWCGQNGTIDVLL